MRAVSRLIGRFAFASLALALIGCAHRTPTIQPLRVEVDPAPSVIEAGLVEVRLTNTTDHERCVWRELLETRDAHGNGALTRLRFNGRPVNYINDEGYVLPPRVNGNRHLAPGEQIVFQVDVRGRHDIGRRARRGRWEVQIGAYGWPCSTQPDEYASVSWSDWTEFLYPSGPGNIR